MARPPIIDLALRVLYFAQLSAAHANLVGRSDPNPDVSSGTCYYSAGQEADSSYIPCGNTAFGTFTCCETSSYCLNENSCFSIDGTTYVAGCTDPTYSDPSCPNKGPYSDQQWSGLVYCNGTSDQWTLCDDSSTDSNQVTYGDPCWCPEDGSERNVAFSAVSTLPATISLPAGIGGTMSFYQGYTPATVLVSTTSLISTTQSSSLSSSQPTTSSSIDQATSSSNTAATVSSSSSSAVASSSPSASASSSSSIFLGTIIPATSASSPASTSSGVVPGTVTHSSELSIGAKVGIGIGASLGGLAVLGLIGCIPIYIRRRNRKRSELDGSSFQPHTEVSAMETNHFSGSAQHPYAWSGDKYELSGDEGTSNSGLSPASMQQSWSRPISAEVEGSIPTYHNMGKVQYQALNDGNRLVVPTSSSRPMSTEVEGSTPTYMSMASFQSQDLGDRSPGYQQYKKAEVSPIGVQRVPHSSSHSQMSYRPGRQAGNGVYEMPAHLPGSTIL